MKTEIGVFLGLFSSLFQLDAFAKGEVKKQPNILMIMADDCTYTDLPVYGGTNLKLPNIENLANNGVVFNKAFLSMSMCVPCRAELHTGRIQCQMVCAGIM